MPAEKSAAMIREEEERAWEKWERRRDVAMPEPQPLSRMVVAAVKGRRSLRLETIARLGAAVGPLGPRAFAIWEDISDQTVSETGFGLAMGW